MAETSDIQFDRAEFEQQGGAACAHCGTQLRDHYYQVNGLTMCAACCDRVRASGDHGSRASRVVRALGAGTAAALGGSLLYWAILALTGYEFGLIAIVVGVAVGKAVSWGSRGKGGWRYQTMAMSLTYVAMVTAYVPMIIGEIRKPPAAESSAVQTASNTANAAPEAAPQPDTEPPVTLARALIGIAILIGLACALPFLGGIENILGIAILAFGLYEAWKLNRRTELSITGPHAIAPAQLT